MGVVNSYLKTTDILILLLALYFNVFHFPKVSVDSIIESKTTVEKPAYCTIATGITIIPCII